MWMLYSTISVAYCLPLTFEWANVFLSLKKWKSGYNKLTGNCEMKEQPSHFLYVNSYVFAFCQTHILKTGSVLAQGNECRFVTELITLICATGITFSQLVINSSANNTSFTINSTKNDMLYSFHRGTEVEMGEAIDDFLFSWKSRVNKSLILFLKGCKFNCTISFGDHLF